MNDLRLSDFAPIIIATVTIFFSSFFGYLFTLRRESKQAYNKYRIEILENLYSPIYKVLIQEIWPGEGYEGIDLSQFTKIKSIVDENSILVDPKLDNLVWSLAEDAHKLGYVTLDADRYLFNHVIKEYNALRKSVGLPHEKEFKRIKNKVRMKYLLLKIKIKHTNIISRTYCRTCKMVKRLVNYVKNFQIL